MRQAIAAAGVLLLGATALAFFLDRNTKEGQRKHSKVEGKAKALRKAYAEAQQTPSQTLHERARLAQETLQLRADACRGYLHQQEGTQGEFALLGEDLRRSLADVTISPFRRNALRLLQAQLENSIHRLASYRQYGDWYLAKQEELFKRCYFDELFEMPLPMPRLPDEWYYPGKVGLITLSEVGSKNFFGQRMELLAERLDEGHYSDAFQRALMMQHPDQEEIPVQLLPAKDPRFFKACVVRGALHIEHALEKLPCVATVVRSHTHQSLGEGYEVRCFPAFCKLDNRQSVASGIRAFLPLSESSFPGKRYPRGEKIEVLLHHYDLMLKDRELTVTQQRESLAIGTTNQAPILITANTSEHDLLPLLMEAKRSPWHLRKFSDDGTVIQVALKIGPWLVEATSTPQDSTLCIDSIEHVGLDSLELQSLPFAIRLVDHQLSALVHVDALQFDQFRQFCRQQELFGADEDARRAAGEFFQRWDWVIDYLLEQSAYQTFELLSVDLMPKDREDETICTCSSDLGGAIEQLDEGGRRPPRLYIEAKYVGVKGERWIQIAELTGVPEAIGRDRYRLVHAGVRLPGPESGQASEDAAMRLRIPNGGELANLTRQKRALQAFMGGRLLNPKLQQILLMPARYQTEPDRSWAHRVKQGLAWRDPNWQSAESATKAKQIIEAALIESNLYLIQGPPGTGKTTCIVELLHQIYAANPDTRVLVVSQQNTAVDNAISRYLKRFPGAADKVLRISRDATKVHEDLRPRVTESVLSDYLIDRQQDYSLSAAKGEDARAAWLLKWMGSIYNQDDEKQPFDDELTELLVGDHTLVGATCVGLASRRYGVDRLSFDICIIDEGGRSTVPELLIPLMRSRKAIIIGDHFQLPPSVARELHESEAKQTLPFLEETFLKTSFFEQLYEHLPASSRGRLEEQFRMVEPIGDLVAELFYSYEGKRGLVNGQFNGKPHDRSDFLDPQRTLRWHDVPDGRQEKEGRVGPSVLNVREAEAVCDFIAQAARTLRARKRNDDFVKKSVAVITPYGAQKRLISQILAIRAKENHSVADVLTIEVDTVDSFQGSEADIVLYSTVRTHGNIKFLLDRQRLNVACSRARENLIFFGCARFLQQQELRSEQPLFTRIMKHASFTPPAVEIGLHNHSSHRPRSDGRGRSPSRSRPS